MTAKYEGLEVNEDYPFHKKMWVAQRIGWALMALFLGCAALGLFGTGGTWTDETKKAAWGEARYDQFLRWQAPTRLEIRVSSAAAVDGRINLWVSNEYLDQWKIESMTPEPEEHLAGSERTLLRFKVEESGGMLPIMIYGQAESFGSMDGKLGIAGQAEAIEIRQFVYP